MQQLYIFNPVGVLLLHALSLKTSYHHLPSKST